MVSAPAGTSSPSVGSGSVTVDASDESEIHFARPDDVVASGMRHNDLLRSTRLHGDGPLDAAGPIRYLREPDLQARGGGSVCPRPASRTFRRRRFAQRDRAAIGLDGASLSYIRGIGGHV